jgi:hypothetical protein
MDGCNEVVVPLRVTGDTDVVDVSGGEVVVDDVSSSQPSFFMRSS